MSRKYLEDGTKVRVSKVSGQIIPKPDLIVDRKPRSSGKKGLLVVLFTANWMVLFSCWGEGHRCSRRVQSNLFGLCQISSIYIQQTREVNLMLVPLGRFLCSLLL